MRITRRQLRQLIREALEIHRAPEDLEAMSPEEAYGMGYLKGQDMQCDHPDWSPACVHHDSHSDDPDLDDDGRLSVAELSDMVHKIAGVVSLEPSPPMGSMVEPLMRAIAASPPEGLTAEDLRGMSDETREELRLQLAQAAAHVEHAVRDALGRG